METEQILQERDGESCSFWSRCKTQQGASFEGYSQLFRIE